MEKLPQGKLPPNILSKLLEKINLNKNVLVGPKVGFDSSVIFLENKKIVVTTDPSIYLPKKIPPEMFAFGIVHFAASDIAVFGAIPQFMVYNLLVPVGIEIDFVSRIIELIIEESEKINVSIIGGHTGAYSGIHIPVATNTMIGIPINDRIILPSNAQIGDKIILTKFIGLEFIVALSYYNPQLISEILNENFVKKYREMYRLETVLDEALILAKHNAVHAMHDVTEGGLATALKEIADASNVGFEIFYDQLPIPEDVEAILMHLNIDPFYVSNTGGLLATIPSDEEDNVLKLLRKMNIQASVIGEIKRREDGRYLIKNGKKYRFTYQFKDYFAEHFKI